MDGRCWVYVRSIGPAFWTRFGGVVRPKVSKPVRASAHQIHSKHSGNSDRDQRAVDRSIGQLGSPAASFIQKGGQIRSRRLLG